MCSQYKLLRNSETNLAFIIKMLIFTLKLLFYGHNPLYRGWTIVAEATNSMNVLLCDSAIEDGNTNSRCDIFME